MKRGLVLLTVCVAAAAAAELVDSARREPSRNSCKPWAYVHVPKCGGSTIWHAIMGFSAAMSRDSPLPAAHFLDGKETYERYRQILFHAPAVDQFEACRAKPGCHWANVSSFATVRNPYDMVVSGLHELFKECNLDGDLGITGRIACEHKERFQTASPEDLPRLFLEWLVDLDQKDALLEAADDARDEDLYLRYLSSPAAKRVLRSTNHSWGAAAWLIDERHRVLVKDIEKLEDEAGYATLASRAALLARLCGRPAPAGVAPHGHANRGNHTDPRLYYSAAACAIVARRARLDFELFGYDVDECVGVR